MSSRLRYVIVDVEATCWNDSRPRDQMEIIEIGAVRLDGDLRFGAPNQPPRTSQDPP